MAASDFCTAEVSGWTPEARYKTSFYSMLGGVGQTLSMEGFRPVSASLDSPRRGEKSVAHGASRGYRGDFRWEPRRGERVGQSQRYRSSTEIPFFFRNAMNSSWNDLALLLLMGYVVPNRTESRLAYGERTVAGLPCKNMVFGPTPVHPLRRIRFYQTSDLGDGAYRVRRRVVHLPGTYG